MTVLYETNVDDMDPRLWPAVIDKLLAAGAHDAWLTPILMKKGRPAHTLSVLCDEAVAEAVRLVVFTETSTIGIREVPVTRHVLDRHEDHVEVQGEPIRVKSAFHNGELMNRSVEWDDVAAAAEVLGLSAKAVLAAAIAATYETATDES